MAYEYERSLPVEASADRVFALVSDVTRTGEWSVQCTRCEWNGDARGEGATFTGYNRTPERDWQTVSTVVVFDPPREFAWSVGPARVLWGFRIAEQGEHHVLLTHFTRFPAVAEGVFADRFGVDNAAGEIEKRRAAAEAALPVTLAAVKELAESEG